MFKLRFLLVTSGRSNLQGLPLPAALSRSPPLAHRHCLRLRCGSQENLLGPLQSLSPGLVWFPRSSRVSFLEHRSDQVTSPVKARHSVPTACKTESMLALDLGFEAVLDLIPARISDLILHPEAHTPNPDEWFPCTVPDLDLGSCSLLSNTLPVLPVNTVSCPSGQYCLLLQG